MAASKQRMVDGPEDDLLESAAVAKYLGMEVRTLQRLVNSGDFPHPIQTSPGVKVWAWDDVLYWVLRCKLRSRLIVAPPKPKKTPK